MSFFGHISTHNVESAHCGQMKLIKHCLIPRLLAVVLLGFQMAVCVALPGLL